jgi:type III secretion protein V
VILTAANVARKLRRLIELEFPRVTVLSYLDLAPDVHIAPVERIGDAGTPGEPTQKAG